MKLLNDLLKAVITYQDLIDFDDYGLKAKLKIDMLDKMDEATKKFPETIAMYNFTDHKDVQMEFDCLQEYIDDFYEFEEKVNVWRRDEIHYKNCCYGNEYDGSYPIPHYHKGDIVEDCDCNMTRELAEFLYKQGGKCLKKQCV